MNDNLVYISKITKLRDDLYKSLEFINWKDHIKKDSNVFIKPNFTFPSYREGITTSPELLKNLLEILKERTDNIILGESNGGRNYFTADDSFQGHGMYDICEDLDVQLVNLSKSPSRFVEEEIQGKTVKVQLPKLLIDDVDVTISVPVLKLHAMTNVTMSIKNLWGCHPDPMRCLYHKNLSHKLTLITKVLNPKIVVMDGIYALDGHGPMYGEPKRLDLLLSSNNPVAIDSVGAAIMGIPLANADHILTAGNERLGSTDLEKIKMNDDWRKFEMQFHMNKTLIDNLSRILFESESIAKIVMDSPVTPLIYKFARFLRNSEEQEVVNEMETYCK